MRKLLVIFSILSGLTANTFASSIQVQRRGPGASGDRFVYDAIFSSSIGDNDGSFSLNADGSGPGNQNDINNRFQGIKYSSQLKKDSRGRALSLTLRGSLLPGNRNIDLNVDLSRASTRAELQFSREDGDSVFATLNCTTTLAQTCKATAKCYKHCHPMIGCDEICNDVTTCTAGKFASDD